MEALKSKLKKVGSKVAQKLGEATMTEKELRVKKGYEKPLSNEEELKKAQEATTIPSRPAPSVMKVGKRIIK